jgi:hypothetical protein
MHLHNGIGWALTLLHHVDVGGSCEIPHGDVLRVQMVQVIDNMTLFSRAPGPLGIRDVSADTQVLLPTCFGPPPSKNVFRDATRLPSGLGNNGEMGTRKQLASNPVVWCSTLTWTSKPKENFATSSSMTSTPPSHECLLSHTSSDSRMQLC